MSLNPKARHYWTQLRAALTAGQWRSHFPAKTPNGVALSWSELFRKFIKHCRGAQDVAHVASYTHTLALFILKDPTDEDDDNDCLVSEAVVDQIKEGYEQLKSLQSSNLDTIHFALAYYAYALGNPAQCIAHLEKVPELNQVRSHTPTSLGSSTNLLAPSTTSSFTPSFTSVVPEVIDGRGLAFTESFRSICLQGMALERLHPTSPSTALQTYRSVLPHLFPSLKSNKSLLNHNNLNPKSPSTKPDFTVFHRLRELWRWVERIIWRAVVLCATVCDVTKGWNADEQNADENEQQGREDSLWIWLSHYTYYSAYWPSKFRTSHRSTVASIHMRALILLRRPSPSLPIPSSPSSYIPSPSPKPLKKTLPAWLNQARLVIKDYQAILSVSTSFPPAGTRNEKVEELVDLCVAVWEIAVFAGGAGHIGWVVDILWWATRLTFNSSRVLRHMTRLLSLSGDTKLAKRTLNLYIQVVGKAYETSGNVGVSLGSEGQEEDTDTDSNWVDTLIFGVAMLYKPSCPSFSSLSPSPPSSEMDNLNEAHQIIEKAKTRLNKEDKRLVAKVLLAEGVYWMMLGVKGQDPLVRPTQLSQSHTLLLQSVRTDPTPDGYYHLALSYAIPGGAAAEGSTPTSNNASNYNLDQAIQYAGLAVEADSRDVKYWHLLGLLLAAQERWEEAREVLERGSDLRADDGDGDVEAEVGEGLPSMNGDEDKETDTIDDTGTVQADVRTLLGPPVPIQKLTSNGDPMTSLVIKTNGIENVPIDNDLPPPITSTTSSLQLICVLSQPSAVTGSTPSLPPASTLLLTPPPCRYPPSTYDLFESHLQLRMTQGTVMEITKGAEGAEELWLQVFGWVAEMRSATAAAAGEGGGVGGVQRRSIDAVTHRSSDHVSGSQHNTTTTIDVSPHHLHPTLHHHHHHHQQMNYLGAPMNLTQVYQSQAPGNDSFDLNMSESHTDSLSPPPPIPITISPATPIASEKSGEDGVLENEKQKEKRMDKEKGREKEKEKRTLNNAFRPKRSMSIDIERGDNNRLDHQKSKKNVGQMLKGSVRKSRAGLSAATKKLGHGVVRHGGLRRANSTPDFHAVFQQQTSYQVSSIHSRRRLSFISTSRTSTESPTLPPPPPTIAITTQHHQQPPAPVPTPTSSTAAHHLLHQEEFQQSEKSIKENRLLSDLWLMSAATFRRIGKIDQAKGAIQEAEVSDENNPAVWVQFGLYYIAIGLYQHAVDTFQKALFICPDDVSATVHLSRLYLDPDLNARLHAGSSSGNQSTTIKPTTIESQQQCTTTANSSSPSPLAPTIPNSDVDLAAGMLSYLTKGRGWNVPEAWYYLAKAYGLQGRKEKEREFLRLALELSERRGVRDIGSALGWCYL